MGKWKVNKMRNMKIDDTQIGCYIHWVYIFTFIFIRLGLFRSRISLNGSFLCVCVYTYVVWFDPTTKLSEATMKDCNVLFLMRHSWLSLVFCVCGWYVLFLFLFVRMCGHIPLALVSWKTIFNYYFWPWAERRLYREWFAQKPLSCYMHFGRAFYSCTLIQTTCHFWLWCEKMGEWTGCKEIRPADFKRQMCKCSDDMCFF